MGTVRSVSKLTHLTRLDLNVAHTEIGAGNRTWKGCWNAGDMGRVMKVIRPSGELGVRFCSFIFAQSIRYE